MTYLERGTEESGAWFDRDWPALYRYLLWRQIRPSLYAKRGDALFIGLNPSTADEHQDDPTIRRCKAFTEAWGFDRYVMANLFAYRSRYPNIVIRPSQGADFIGPENTWTIVEAARKAGIVVCAWGRHHRGSVANRAAVVAEALRAEGVTLYCLRHNGDGSPVHPLYQPKTLTPIRLE